MEENISKKALDTKSNSNSNGKNSNQTTKSKKKAKSAQSNQINSDINSHIPINKLEMDKLELKISVQNQSKLEGIILNSPQSTFPIRANKSKQEPRLLERWKNENLYEKIEKMNSGSQCFILHDGPPYANGKIHLGHCMNKAKCF